MSAVEVKLLPHQKQFVTSQDPHPAIVGGLGSGKTEGGILRLLLLMLQDKTDVLYTMPTYDLLRLRAIPGFIETIERMGLSIPYVLNKSEMSIEFKGYGKVYFRSYDKPERLIAFEVGHAIVDEIDTLNREKAELVWRKINERVRALTPVTGMNTIACVTTPDQGFSGFVYNKWVKEGLRGYSVIKASTYDNPFLPDDYTEQIKANYDPVLADLYLKGEFVSLNRNKQFWAFDRKEHHTDEEFSPDEPLIYYAVDFNVGGCVVTMYKYLKNTLYACDELVAQNTQEIPVKLSARYPKAKFIAYPDASGGNESANADETSINILSMAGHRIDAPKANPKVRASINSVNSAFSHGRLKINTVKCPMLTEAVESLGYDDKGRPEKFDNHPSWDDYGDTLRYIVHRKMPTRRPTLITNTRS